MQNVIFVIADQMRWDALPCNGADFIQAPHFDRLAAAGTNFTCAYSGNPVCVPARGVLATGCYSHRCMSPTARGANIGTIIRTHIARHMKNHGYATYGFGKFHHLPYKSNPGFDVFELAEEGRIDFMRHNGSLEDPAATEDYLEYLRGHGLWGYQRAHGIGNNDARGGRSPLPAEHYVDAWSTTRAIETLRQHVASRASQPFFLQLGWVKPHAPYDPPAPFDQMYDPRSIPKPWGSPEDMVGRNPMMPTLRFNYLIDQMSEAAIQYSRAHYFGLVSFLDAQMGRLLDALDELWLRDNTLIVFTADHGDNLGDHGVFFKTVLTEGSAHIPLIVCPPGGGSGRVCHQPVGQEDIVPTICDLAGVKPIADVNGRSLAPLLESPEAKHKPFVISQHGQGDRMTLMLREPRFKYCYARYEGTEELYDMAADPREAHNLASQPEHRASLERLRGLADRWCRENDHDPVCGEDGQPLAAPFTLEEHLVEPSKVLGIRPW